MKQALRIFEKDVRRLWPQILVVAVLFGDYALLPPGNPGAGITSLLEKRNFLELLIAIACWMLGASVVHEDAPAQESPFWITRPYCRDSLLTSKALFLFVFVFLPLAVSGVVLEVRNGISVSGNAGTLLVLDVAVAEWLILPSLAIGGVTRDLKEFSGGLGILAVAYYFVSRLTITRVNLASLLPVADGPNVVAILPMVLVAMGVVGLQYAARKTMWSGAALLLAVIGSAFLMPRSSVARLSTRIVNPPGFDLRQIRISFDESVPPKYRANDFAHACPLVALKVEGLPQGMILRTFGPTAGEVSSPSAGARKIEKILFEDSAEGYGESMCVPMAPLQFRFQTIVETVRASLSVEVVAVETVARLPAKPGAYSAGGAGRCEILTPFPENTQLRCDLAEPLVGTIGAGLEFQGYKVYSESFMPSSGPLRLSPVSLRKFDGVSFDRPGGWPFSEAFEQPDAHFVLRTERVLGTVRRDLIYHNFVRPPLPRIPKPVVAK
jgi:hypothetical protein